MDALAGRSGGQSPNSKSSVQPPCSLYPRGESFVSIFHHGGTEGSEVTQRKPEMKAYRLAGTLGVYDPGMTPVFKYEDGQNFSTGHSSQSGLRALQIARP